MIRCLSESMGRLVLLAVFASAAWGDHVPELRDGQSTALDRKVEKLKQEVLEINRDLSLLEQELLFPSNTQFAVFVTLEDPKSLTVNSAQLQVDQRLASSHIYANHEVDALRKGGAHRLHLGNLSAGKHKISATVIGRYAGGREFRRVAELDINKGLKPVHVELRLSQASQSAEPVLVVKQW